jgi:transcriptional regulator with XRE-family HTH domain
MMRSTEDIKLIFGMKLKKLRTDKKLSLQQLSSKTNISVSYLNEIEKGKKYPKANKIADLAEALDISYDQLVSLKLQKNLTTVGQVLNFEIIHSIPFETFGMDKKAIMNMIAEEPAKMAAFFNTIIELAGHYQVKPDHFYFTMLRAYIELNDHYFEHLEQAAATYRNTWLTDCPKTDSSLLQQLLRAKHQLQLRETDFADFPKLRGFRSVYFAQPRPTLLYNAKLTEQQKTFLFGREIGCQLLTLENRPMTTSWLTVDSYEQVLNNFYASYFAQALLLEKESFLEQLKQLFIQKKWQDKSILQLLQRYDCSAEMLLQRMSNLLPRYFGAQDLFFIRYSSKEPEKHLKEVSKEIHLTRQVGNLRHLFSERAYRRWITKKLVTRLAERAEKEQADTLIEAVIHENEHQQPYFILSIHRKMPELSHKANSVTLGFLLTETLKQKIAFLQDATLRCIWLDPFHAGDEQSRETQRRLQDIEDKERELERLKSSL